MASRSRYLLTYDIRDAKRLRRVHKVASTFGEPLQYSVFVCDLTATERARCREELREQIRESIDSVALFDLGPATKRGVECVEYLGMHRPIESGGPILW